MWCWERVKPSSQTVLEAGHGQRSQSRRVHSPLWKDRIFLFLCLSLSEYIICKSPTPHFTTGLLHHFLHLPPRSFTLGEAPPASRAAPPLPPPPVPSGTDLHIRSVSGCVLQANSGIWAASAASPCSLLTPKICLPAIQGTAIRVEALAGGGRWRNQVLVLNCRPRLKRHHHKTCNLLWEIYWLQAFLTAWAACIYKVQIDANGHKPPACVVFQVFMCHFSTLPVFLVVSETLGITKPNGIDLINHQRLMGNYEMWRTGNDRKRLPENKE